MRTDIETNEPLATHIGSMGIQVVPNPELAAQRFIVTIKIDNSIEFQEPLKLYKVDGVDVSTPLCMNRQGNPFHNIEVTIVSNQGTETININPKTSERMNQTILNSDLKDIDLEGMPTSIPTNRCWGTPFAHQLIECAIKSEEILDPLSFLILDRSLPDRLAFHRLLKLDLKDLHSVVTRYRYQKIFLFERLPTHADRVRTETDHESEQLETFLYDAYVECGYEVIRVPRFTEDIDTSISNRFKFIKQQLRINP